MKTLFSIEKKKRNAFLITTAATVVVLFVLLPLEIYFFNAISLNIMLSHFFLPMAILALLLFLVAIILIPMIFRGIMLNAIILLMPGIAMASSIQSLFLNYNMQQLAGGIVHNSAMNLHNVVNLLIWLIIAFLPLGLGIAKHYRGKKKVAIKKDSFDDAKSIETKSDSGDSDIKQISFEMRAIIISLIIVGIHTVGAISAFITQPSVTLSDDVQGLSISRTFDLSQDKNIVVFLIDRLDVKFMDDLLEIKPELHEQLDGFTYFRNTVSGFTNTFPAVTTFFTNVHKEDDEDAHAFWNRAWNEQTFIDDLIHADFSIYLLPTMTSTALRTNIAHRVDNYINPEDVTTTIEYLNILRIALRLTLNRIAPYLLKDAFLSYLPIDFNNRFITHEPDDFMPATVGQTFDIMYYDNLQSVRLTAYNHRNVFSFVHFYGMHSFIVQPTQSVGLEVLAGCVTDGMLVFKIINEYIAQMKELGIYDNSTIIIMTDHGRQPWEIEHGNSGNAELLMEITSALLIKTENSRGTLEINSTAELTMLQLGASILDIAGLPHERFGLSFFDVINGNISQARELFLFDISAPGGITHRGTYLITGDANNFENWVLQ